MNTGFCLPFMVTLNQMIQSALLSFSMKSAEIAFLTEESTVK
ncbi:hypothetical protein RV03_GL001800 [Enterococcus gallinarum]|nr:hypothetical protein RV03_GL001800 [Enterococcus gallinarum]